MALYFQKTSRPDIAQLLRQDSQSRSEKDRRRFAALEAITLGHGGTRSIAQVLGCDPQTVTDGMRARKQRPDAPAGSRLRTPGGGRTKAEVTHADVTQQVQDTSKDPTAGDPMRPDVLWTALTPQAIAQSLQAHSVGAGPRIVRRLLDGRGVARRPMRKGLPGGDSPHRREQFRHLAHLLQEFLEAGHPVLRLDPKQQACLGTRDRDGQGSGPQALKAFDPDVPSLATGGIMPHGLDARARHQGWRPVGLSRDTTACACDSVRMFWHGDGQRLDPNASAIVLLCAGGGRNRGHTPRCQEDLPGVVNDSAGPLRVAPSPASCSKFTPIERRRFSPVTSAGQGVLVDALHTVLGLRHKTTTPQGLSVTVRVLDTRYAGGRTGSQACKKNMPIIFEKLLPPWNDWALPQ